MIWWYRSQRIRAGFSRAWAWSAGTLTSMKEKRGPQLARTIRINRFIAFQTKRIRRMVEAGNYEGAVLVWMILLKSSISYQLVLYHRATRDWYHKMGESEARTQFVRCVDRIRKWDLTAYLQRFYLKKPNGKMRPIGAPDVSTKMIAKAFNDMTIALFRKDMDDHHHGFLPQRGIHTAILNIMCNYYEKEMTTIYEFDLRSWFNKVNPSWVRKKKIGEKS